MTTGRPRSPGWCTAGGVLAAALVPCAASAAPDPLEAPVRAVWAGLPIRAWAERAGGLAGVPIVVDRRLDPDVTVTGTAAGEPLRAWLAHVAESAGAAVEPLAASVRLVPSARAGLAARAEESRRREIARLSPERRAALAARRAWTWPAGARPRELVAAAVTEAGGTPPLGLDRVPHDHLPAADLPPLSLAERVDLVLAGYDLRLAWNSGPSGTVVPIDSGLAAADTRLSARPRRATPVEPSGELRFTLSLEAPLEEAVRAVAAQLGLAAHVDRESLRAAGRQPGEVVRARAANATQAELLDAIVAPLGLRWRIEGERLVIDAPP